MEAMHHDIVIDPGLVRAKAYEIWQSMGCPEGAAEQTWLEAERQLKSRMTDSKREAAPSAVNAPAAQTAEAKASPASEPPPASDPVANQEPLQDSSTAAKTKKSASGARRTARR